jgi:putative addiction module component (TIGR02574 family)
LRLRGRSVDHGHRTALRAVTSGDTGVRVPVVRGKLPVMSAPIVPPPGFDELPVEEKIAYVQALWDLIAEQPEDVPVPEWQQAILEERIDEARSSAAAVKPWSEVRAELHARLRTVRGG